MAREVRGIGESMSEDKLFFVPFVYFWFEENIGFLSEWLWGAEVFKEIERRGEGQKRDNIVGGGTRPKKNRGSKFAPITIPGYEWVSAKINLYPTQFQTHESIERLKQKVDVIALDDTELLIVEPCSTEECVYTKSLASKGEANFVYMYEDVLKELNIQFPYDTSS